MKLWLFDSWLGGMVVLESFRKYFPTLEILLEMDREHAPYGDRDPDEIRELTRAGVERLYERGADVVILACNTASVHALRWLQQWPCRDKKILWVTIPGAEKVVEEWYKKIWVLATAATVKIRGYKDRVHILDDSVVVEEVACTGLVSLIEKGINSGEGIESLLVEYISQLSPDIEALVLWCTHYPLIQESIEKIWQQVHKTTPPDIIDPGEEAAKKFKSWMEKRGY